MDKEIKKTTGEESLDIENLKEVTGGDGLAKRVLPSNNHSAVQEQQV
jgi:hypothetical protein